MIATFAIAYSLGRISVVKGDGREMELAVSAPRRDDIVVERVKPFVILRRDSVS